MAHPPVGKARQGFANTINRAAYGKSMLGRIEGKDIAAVVPIDDLRLLEDRIDLADARAARLRRRKSRKNHSFIRATTMSSDLHSNPSLLRDKKRGWEVPPHPPLI